MLLQLVTYHVHCWQKSTVAVAGVATGKELSGLSWLPFVVKTSLCDGLVVKYQQSCGIRQH